jgi:hypothetical protein
VLTKAGVDFSAASRTVIKALLLNDYMLKSV